MGNKDKPPPNAKGAREAKLAQALRDNLRRRKASPRESAKTGDREPDPS